MLTAADYQPPRWLRNPHVQSVLGSSPLRRRLGVHALARLGVVSEEVIVDGGEGIRLQGFHSRLPNGEARGLAMLLHGWEGSADSNYMRLTAAQLLQRGFEVFRLNFRDHGDTHHLNEELFHSNRIDEVVHAVGDVARRYPRRPMVLAGYSLGGNFALRVALRALQANLPLAHVVAVCPLLDPLRTMDYIENGLQIYDWYFKRKWRSSLLRKRALFPERHAYDDTVLAQDLRSLMRWLAERHTGFGTLEAYFDGYSIAGDRLAQLHMPADILMAKDDPVIPIEDFRSWSLPASARLEIAACGGHCGFIESARGDGFAERWVADRLEAVLHAQ